ncbi:unnamed protein product [Rhizoctonia solani]|uniref:Uncharacterized protein n=1 Tax=Rhizoctonia solani TaxID=456999 RepID=A0A8H2Y1Q5_9AGAM|nr:unnamed protein product [Rhizoctonia solani]
MTFNPSSSLTDLPGQAVWNATFSTYGTDPLAGVPHVCTALLEADPAHDNRKRSRSLQRTRFGSSTSQAVTNNELGQPNHSDADGIRVAVAQGWSRAI